MKAKSISLITIVAFLGIIGTSKAEAASADWGNFHKTNQYTTIMKDHYKIFTNKNFASSSTTSKYYKKTLKIKGYYNHKNGNRYYSLYNNKDQWVGYVNSGIGRTTTSPWGYKLEGNKPIDTGNGNYGIYRNKSWDKSSTGQNYKGKLVRVYGYYNHFNGNRYYSMKYNDNWIGYMNAKGSYNKQTNGVYQFALDRANQVAKRYGATINSTYRKGDLDYYGTGHGNGLAIDVTVGTAQKVNDSVWKKNQAIQNEIVNNYDYSTEYTITNNVAKGPFWNDANYLNVSRTSDIFKNPTQGHVNHICWHFKKPQEIFKF